jgi:hypothetical protein
LKKPVVFIAFLILFALVGCVGSKDQTINGNSISVLSVNTKNDATTVSESSSIGTLTQPASTVTNIPKDINKNIQSQNVGNIDNYTDNQVINYLQNSVPEIDDFERLLLKSNVKMIIRIDGNKTNLDNSNNQYYSIYVGENHADHTVRWHTFLVKENLSDIYVDDVITGTYHTLNEWRRSQQSSSLEIMKSNSSSATLRQNTEQTTVTISKTIVQNYFENELGKGNIEVFDTDLDNNPEYFGVNFSNPGKGTGAYFRVSKTTGDVSYWMNSEVMYNLIVRMKEQNNSTIDSLIPKGWRIFEGRRVQDVQAIGDLNKDGIDDVAIVIEGEKNKENEAPTRALLIAFGKGINEYSLSIIANKAILKADQGGVFGDPLEGIAVDRGSVVISFYGGSNYRWYYKYRFRFQDNDWYLIGATLGDYYTGTMTMDNANEKDYNLLTGDYVIRETDMYDPSNSKTTSGNRGRTTLLKLKDFYADDSEDQFLK